MTALIELTETLSMAGQIQPADIGPLAAAGYESVICNRPDHEEPNQPTMDSIEKACLEAGITFIRYPVDAFTFPGNDLAAMDEAMNSGKKTLAYCRSGARSTNLWVATLVGEERQAAAVRAQQLGIPLSFVMQLGL